jgi:hypothetical protein
LPAPASIAPQSGRGFLAEIADPAAGGFLAEVWPHLLEAAGAIFPPPPRSRPAPLGPEQSARLAWITDAATAIGLPRLGLFVSREPNAPLVAAVEDGDGALVLGAEAAASPALRFHVGRALGLLAARALILERTRAEDLAPLFASAAILAGVAVPEGLPQPPEGLLRDVTRAVARKDRKALTLQASRFPFDRYDFAAWRTAMLRSADRFGLLVAGDPAQAAAAIAGGARAVAADPLARDLLGFALGERYPFLRRAIEGGR